MICDDCKYRNQDESAWPCKHCTPDDRRFEAEIVTLREQVEKLTKERDIKEHCIVQLEAEDLRAKEQLSAIAEQNEKMRVALQAMVDEAFARNCGLKIADDALSLPDLASPVLNRIRAEGMRMAADICSEKHSLSGAEEAIRARAAELEKTNG